jgi:hypothetical protein
MKIMKNSQVGILKMKTSINQIQTTIDGTISRQDQTKERIPKMEENSEEIMDASNCKERKEYT